MRKLILAMYMSLDGFIEGPNRQFTGPPFTPDLKRKWIDVNIERAGLMLYGRTAYEGMAAYWTSPAADPAEAADTVRDEIGGAKVTVYADGTATLL